jgi:RNA polymerase sigma factor (sigma-70 family)
MSATRLDAMLGATLSFLRLDSRSDAELLVGFLDHQDETAFETLLVRHTPAVRAACRCWLRSAPDIDDATQATFLVLVQRAWSIRNRTALGPWLYGVAYRVARRLRRQQRTLPLPLDVSGGETPAYDDLKELLAQEVARLSEKYRLPVQLCYCLGLTTDEAAQRLGWPRGTVLTRLAWARRHLQKRLTRRGVAPALLPGLAQFVRWPVNRQWLQQTTRAAFGTLHGEPLISTDVSVRTVSLAKGVVRAMIWDKFKYLTAAVLVLVGLAGYGIGQWVTASDGSANARDTRPEEPGRRPAREHEQANAAPKESTKPDEPRSGRRREAIIRAPVGSFVKEVDAAPYGSGRLTWTYEDDRVLGLIEGSIMGVEFELATEAEYSLSSSGTIYGIITSVHLNHLRLPDGDLFAQLKPFAGLWTAVEPVINEMLIDLPFSYQCRVHGDRITISNYRILLTGPNPLGKLGALGGLNGNSELCVALAGFQALGTAIEGTYVSAESKEAAPPARRPLFMKARNQGDPRKSK